MSAQAQSASTPQATPAAAAPAPPSEATKKEARQAYSDGQKAYEAKDYATATTHFSKANALIPSPHALYWVAMSYDKQGLVPEAHGAYTAFFADAGHTKLGEDKLKVARARLLELASITAQVTLTASPPEATLNLDGAPYGGTSPFSLQLPAGKHRLQVSANGFATQEKEIEVAPGQTLNEAITLEALPAEPAPVAKPAAKPEPTPEPRDAPLTEPEKSRVAAYVTLGVAGASAIAGTIFGLQALSAKSDFDDNPTEANADDVERNGLIADMAFGIAVTLGVTGIVLLTSDDPEAGAAKAARPEPKRAPRLIVAPYIAPKSGGAAARWTF